MGESHFSNQCMKLCNLGAVNAGIVVAIMEPRVGGGGLFPSALPMTDEVIMADA